MRGVSVLPAALLFFIALRPLGVNSAATLEGASRPSSSNVGGTGRRSIRDWVTCDGNADDAIGAARAIAAAAHGAFTLVVDCPVRVKIGMDISRSIFIDDDTNIEFTGAGELTVDNVFIPAFVIANSHNIRLTAWNVKYDASLPVDPVVEGYYRGGKLVPEKQPSAAFSEERVTPWLAEHRDIRFDGSRGHITSLWTGSTPMCAVFFITGDSSHVVVTGMQVAAPQSAGGERFIPVVFSLNPNFKSKQSVTAKTPINSQFVAVPHDLSFSGINLDGTYMGWVGTLQGATIDNVHSGRYADLQDAKGDNVGGMRKWFAPPHLIYFTRYSATEDLALSNRDIEIRNVVDEGVRIGGARDRPGEALSGNALSLKIGCTHCSVDRYKSARPDGLLDVLASDGLTISNVEATYNSAFLNNLYPGWRFPQAPYTNVKFENITLTDQADSTLQAPISNLNQGAIQGIVMRNIRVDINRWESPAAEPFPKMVGQGIDVALNYSVRSDKSMAARSQNAAVEITLRALPATLHAGDATTLTWATRQADGCAGSGAWSGSIPVAGSRSIVMSKAGSAEFTLQCQSGQSGASGTVSVTVL
jgi:hypothetical protein